MIAGIALRGWRVGVQEYGVPPSFQYANTPLLQGSLGLPTPNATNGPGISVEGGPV